MRPRLAPLCVVLAACGVEQEAADTLAPDAADLHDGDASDASGPTFASPYCASLPAGAPLGAGRWASRQRSAAIVQLPPTNTPTTVVTTRLVLHTVTAADGGADIRHEVCSLRQPKLNGVETLFGPGFIGAVPRNTVRATLDGTAVAIPADLVVLGADVDADDPLPTDAADPRVRDSDEDGKPGVSVTLQGLFAGQLYVVYRQSLAMTGAADPAGCVAGLIAGPSEQIQLGANPVELEQIDLSPVPHPDPTLSTFQLVPLGRTTDVPSELDCAGLAERELTLFGPEP